MDLSTIVTYVGGIIAIFIVAKILLFPFRLIGKLIGNAILGGIMLFGINLIGSAFGFELAINWTSTLIAGTLGIPGVVLLIIWKLFF